MKRRILNGSKRAIRGLLQGALSVLALLAKPRASEHEMAAPPMRILLMDGAHIGDPKFASTGPAAKPATSHGNVSFILTPAATSPRLSTAPTPEITFAA